MQGSQHISVLTTCTFMFRQVCIIEPSFFNAASGMHRHSIEGRHLVGYWAPVKFIWSHFNELFGYWAPVKFIWSHFNELFGYWASVKFIWSHFNEILKKLYLVSVFKMKCIKPMVGVTVGTELGAEID